MTGGDTKHTNWCNYNPVNLTKWFVDDLKGKVRLQQHVSTSPSWVLTCITLQQLTKWAITFTGSSHVIVKYMYLVRMTTPQQSRSQTTSVWEQDCTQGVESCRKCGSIRRSCYIHAWRQITSYLPGKNGRGNCWVLAFDAAVILSPSKESSCYSWRLQV